MTVSLKLKNNVQEISNNSTEKFTTVNNTTEFHNNILNDNTTIEKDVEDIFNEEPNSNTISGEKMETTSKDIAKDNSIIMDNFTEITLSVRMLN